MKRKLLIAAVAFAVLAVIGYFQWVNQTNSTLEKGFETISRGMPREKVIALMGEPSSEANVCEEELTWLGEPVSEPCSVELRYSARLKPVYWTVNFSRENHVIAKYEYVSP